MSTPHYADVSKKPALEQLVSVQFREGQDFTKPTFHYLRATLVGEFCRFLANATNKTVRLVRPESELSDVSRYSASYFDPNKI